MTVGSDNPFPSVELVESTTPATPASGRQRLFVDAADGLFKLVDDTGTVTTPGGSTDLDAIIAASSGQDVADALAGATAPDAGNVFATIADVPGGGGIPTGTSMPVSPSTNDLIFRTDLGLVFYYDGTRWLSLTLYTLSFGPMDIGGTWPFTTANSGNVMGRASLWHSDFAIWLVSLYGITYTLATNNGSDFWTFTLVGAVTGTNYGNFTTAADTAATYTGHKAALNQVAGSTERGIYVNPAKSGTPGNVYAPTTVTYRLIGV
jgi:hypothetical protein